MGQTSSSVEAFNLEEGEWELKSKNEQFEHGFTGFTVVTLGSETLCFGGRHGMLSSPITNEVYRLFNYRLLRFGQSLLNPRQRHQSVVSGSTIVHVGGENCQYFEVWEQLEVGVFNIRQSPGCLSAWSEYPNSFVIDN